MSGEALGTYTLRCGVAALVRLLWEDRAFYEEFLRVRLKDIAIEVGEWETDAASSTDGLVARTRKVCGVCGEGGVLVEVKEDA